MSDTPAPVDTPAVPVPSPATPVPGTPVTPPAAPAATKETAPEANNPPPTNRTELTKEPPAKATEAASDVTFKLPDGVAADETLTKEFLPIAKELGLKSEGAQKLVDLYFKAQTDWQAKGQEAHAKQTQDWVAAAKADKELGGEKFDSNVQTARQALSKFGTPELRQLLDSSGLGNNPELIRFMHRVGKAMGEDSISGTTSGQSANGVPSEEAMLRLRYPTMFQKE